jgi:hypothetical protein
LLAVKAPTALSLAQHNQHHWKWCNETTSVNGSRLKLYTATDIRTSGEINAYKNRQMGKSLAVPRILAFKKACTWTFRSRRAGSCCGRRRSIIHWKNWSPKSRPRTCMAKRTGATRSGGKRSSQSGLTIPVSRCKDCKERHFPYRYLSTSHPQNGQKRIRRSMASENGLMLFCIAI